jgi:hypothetical protein
MCSPCLPTAIPGELGVDATNLNLVMPTLFDAVEHRDKAMRDRLVLSYQMFRNAYSLSFDMARRRVSSDVSSGRVKFYASRQLGGRERLHDPWR